MTAGHQPVSYPRPPDIWTTSHGLHLALTVILGLISFGVLGVVWVCVWLLIAVVNDSHNYRERRRYERETLAWEKSALAPLSADEIGPFTHDVWLNGIGWRTVKAVTADTVTVNGCVEDETYPRSWIVDSVRRKRPARPSE